MAQQARRGFMPTDERDFRDKALPMLRKAAKDKIIVSTDSIILDECNEWFNLAKYIVDMKNEAYPYIDIIPE